MERKGYQTCFDPSLTVLKELLDHLQGYHLHNLESSINTMRIDLSFFKMLFWMLAYSEESKCDWYLQFAINSMGPKLSQTVKEFNVDYKYLRYRNERINWEGISYDLATRIKQFKPQAKEICIHFLGNTYKSKSCEKNLELFCEYARDTAFFIDFIRQNLTVLLKFNNDLIPFVKNQIIFIQRKLKEFSRFDIPINHSITRVKKLCEVISRTRTWANHISCLTCLYWIDGRDESLASTIDTMFSNFMHKTMPYTSRVIASYLEDTMIPQLLANYFDFLLEDLAIHMKDDVEIFRDGLIFLLSFLINPPEEDLENREFILAQIYAILNELPSLVYTIRFDEIKKGILKAKFLGFLNKIDKLKGKVRELYVITPHSWQLNSPKTNAKGFLDSLLRTLKKMLEAEVNFIPSIKYQVEVLQKELVLLRPLLQSNIGLQNEHKKFKDLWSRTIDTVYHASYVSNLCFSRSFSLWYGILDLPSVIEEVKFIMVEFKKIEDHHMCKNKILHAEMELSIDLAQQPSTSKIEGDFIGFKKDVRLIINYLTSEQNDLTIISISGLPGQGKTTLAKRIYNDDKIQHHFHKIVWCNVSKECNARELLVKIGCDLIDASVTNLKFEDLFVLIWRSLKKQKYLIVMDDLWDVNLWNQVEKSFPDDKTRSRILFTSRNDSLASQITQKSISHCLQLFCMHESWELMKEKLFSGKRRASPEFVKVAQQIASDCKGLPLAIVLVASLLKKMEQKLDLWSKVATNLKSHIASEGLRNLIELSYEYLPDYLKPCFLYFGIIPRGTNIRANYLRNLWITEGFIKDNEMHCSEDLANVSLDNLAKKYVDDLVSQNLIMVEEKSSMGGIKLCTVHDLLYDFCLEKAHEDNFLNCIEKSLVMDQCYSSPHKYRQHRLYISVNDHFTKPRPICSKKQFLISHVHSCLCIHDDHPWDTTLESISWFLKSFKVLTVLTLDGVNIKCDEFPKFILSMVHLRHLTLNFTPMVGGIPSSIANLWNLETLIIGGGVGKLCCLPLSMWRMKSLRIVDVRYCCLHLDDFDENDLFEAYNIQKLGTVGIIYCGKTGEFLKKLPKLRKLCCGLFKKEELHSFGFSMFGSLTQLESLHIRYAGDDDKYLYKKDPNFNSLNSLKKLTLSRLKLPWSAISGIGKQLPNLQVLKLLDYACDGSRWTIEDGDFSKLIYLKLCSLMIEVIDVSGCDDNPFPWLEELVVKSCPNLKEIPSSFGEISTLNTIKMILSSPEAKNSLRQIWENQQDLENHDFQVFIGN